MLVGVFQLSRIDRHGGYFQGRYCMNPLHEWLLMEMVIQESRTSKPKASCGTIRSAGSRFPVLRHAPVKGTASGPWLAGWLD